MRSTRRLVRNRQTLFVRVVFFYWKTTWDCLVDIWLYLQYYWADLAQTCSLGPLAMSRILSLRLIHAMHALTSIYPENRLTECVSMTGVLFSPTKKKTKVIRKKGVYKTFDVRLTFVSGPTVFFFNVFKRVFYKHNRHTEAVCRNVCSHTVHVENLKVGTTNKHRSHNVVTSSFTGDVRWARDVRTRRALSAVDCPRPHRSAGLQWCGVGAPP